MKLTRNKDIERLPSPADSAENLHQASLVLRSTSLTAYTYISSQSLNFSLRLPFNHHQLFTSRMLFCTFHPRTDVVENSQVHPTRIIRIVTLPITNNSFNHTSPPVARYLSPGNPSNPEKTTLNQQFTRIHHSSRDFPTPNS